MLVWFSFFLAQKSNSRVLELKNKTISHMFGLVLQKQFSYPKAIMVEATIPFFF